MQGEATPLVVFGLLQHETRLSVLNFAVKKVSDYQEPIANKQRLLLATGFRYFTIQYLSTHKACIKSMQL